MKATCEQIENKPDVQQLLALEEVQQDFNEALDIGAPNELIVAQVAVASIEEDSENDSDEADAEEAIPYEDEGEGE